MSNLCTFDSKREGEISLYCSGTSYDKLEIHFTDEEEHTYGYYEGIVEKLGVGQYQYEQHNTDGKDDCSEEENDDSDEDSEDGERVHRLNSTWYRVRYRFFSVSRT